jgi:hypothetical protein
MSGKGVWKVELGERTIRVYLSHNEVVGFAHQYPRGLGPAGAGEAPRGRVFEPPTAPTFTRLREQMERR